MELLNNEIKEEKNNQHIVDNSVENTVDTKIELEQEVTVDKQNKFLESSFGKIINTGLDLGLKAILPNVIEEQIIDIKNVLLKSGLKEGINTAIKSAIELGKSSMGIITGKFENLSQVNTAIKKGGIIDSISSVLDNVLNSSTKNNLLNKGTAKIIKKGKNIILNTVSNSIEEKYLEDVNSLEKISKYISNWKNYYNLKDINGMEKEYKKIKNKLETVVALENTINDVKKVENLHNLIKNKGVDYELSEEEKQLIEILK